MYCLPKRLYFLHARNNLVRPLEPFWNVYKCTLRKVFKFQGRDVISIFFHDLDHLVHARDIYVESGRYAAQFVSHWQLEKRYKVQGRWTNFIGKIHNGTISFTCEKKAQAILLWVNTTHEWGVFPNLRQRNKVGNHEIIAAKKLSIMTPLRTS